MQQPAPDTNVQPPGRPSTARRAHTVDRPPEHAVAAGAVRIISVGGVQSISIVHVEAEGQWKEAKQGGSEETRAKARSQCHEPSMFARLDCRRAT